MLTAHTWIAALLAPPGAPRRAAVVRMTSPDDTNIDHEYILSLSRRKVIAAATAGLGAEQAWRQAVAAATDAIEEVPNSSILPPGTVEQIQAGRAVVVNNWLPPEECAALQKDQIACLERWEQTKTFREFKSNIHSGLILSMPSFYFGGKSGPFVDPSVGDYAVRQNLMARMAVVKAALANQANDRPTLANGDLLTQTHEIQYLHYNPGAQVYRHVDDRHVELKRPNGSRLQKRPGSTRRSITWLVYLNDDWDPKSDGGQLRLHERAQPAAAHVGAAGPDLQVGWLRATNTDGEQPVFLDPFRDGPTEDRSFMLYTCDADGNKRDLSREPFANEVLRRTGGDSVVASLMVDSPNDAKRFHLIDAPRTKIDGVAQKLLTPDAKGEDGGERVRDIVPRAGTLVLFDSVSLPHEVLATTRKRYGLQGWFHEKLFY